jgi:hypothetical protein
MTHGISIGHLGSKGAVQLLQEMLFILGPTNQSPTRRPGNNLTRAVGHASFLSCPVPVSSAESAEGF